MVKLKMSRIYTPRFTGNSPFVAGDVSAVSHEKTGSFSRLCRAANTPVEPARPGGQSAEVGTVRSDSWRFQNVNKRLDSAPVDGAPQVRRISQSTPVPVQSAKSVCFDVLEQNAQRVTQILKNKVYELSGPVLSSAPSELDMQNALKALQPSRVALTDTVWKRWFSPKYRRAAAALRSVQASSEAAIIDRLTHGKLSALSNKDVSAIKSHPALSPEAIKEQLAKGSPLYQLETILTAEWRAASPGFAALAKKASQVRVSLDEIETLFAGQPGKRKTKQPVKGAWKYIKLVLTINSGVPPHLHKFVKEHILPCVVGE